MTEKRLQVTLSGGALSVSLLRRRLGLSLVHYNSLHFVAWSPDPGFCVIVVLLFCAADIKVRVHLRLPLPSHARSSDVSVVWFALSVFVWLGPCRTQVCVGRCVSRVGAVLLNPLSRGRLLPFRRGRQAVASRDCGGGPDTIDRVSFNSAHGSRDASLCRQRMRIGVLVCARAIQGRFVSSRVEKTRSQRDGRG